MNNQNLITELQSRKISNNYLKFITQFPEQALTSSNVKLEIKMILNSKYDWRSRSSDFQKVDGFLSPVSFDVFWGPSEVAKLAPTTITTDLEKNHSRMSHIWVRFLRFY